MLRQTAQLNTVIPRKGAGENKNSMLLLYKKERSRDSGNMRDDLSYEGRYNNRGASAVELEEWKISSTTTTQHRKGKFADI